MPEVFKIISVYRASPVRSADVMHSDIQHFSLPLLDKLGRPLRDLRISVTDRCNLRCTYCMPREVFDENHPFLPRGELLSFEEIARLAGIFISLGVQKIRLTGGEPLLRKGIEKLIEKLAVLKTQDGKQIDIAMTTNGVALAQKARSLKDAGLARLSISLDSLDNSVFQRVSDSNFTVDKVLEGIEAAQMAGFASIKVNMVVQRGVNDHEIVDMAEHFRHTGIVLRYIEYMDVGSSNGWRLDDVVSAREILAQITTLYPIRPVDANYTGEVASRWQYADGGGELGVIASVTDVFCRDCTRIRLSTDGKLYNCLFAAQGIDLRAPLRNGQSDTMLINLIASNWSHREDRYSELRTNEQGRTDKIEMSYIGG